MKSPWASSRYLPTELFLSVTDSKIQPRATLPHITPAFGDGMGWGIRRLVPPELFCLSLSPSVWEVWGFCDKSHRAGHFPRTACQPVPTRFPKLSDSQSEAEILGYKANSISYSRGKQSFQRITETAWHHCTSQCPPPQKHLCPVYFEPIST